MSAVDAVAALARAAEPRESRRQARRKGGNSRRRVMAESGFASAVAVAYSQAGADRCHSRCRRAWTRSSRRDDAPAPHSAPLLDSAQPSQGTVNHAVTVPVLTAFSGLGPYSEGLLWASALPAASRAMQTQSRPIGGSPAPSHRTHSTHCRLHCHADPPRCCCEQCRRAVLRPCFADEGGTHGYSKGEVGQASPPSRSAEVAPC